MSRSKEELSLERIQELVELVMRLASGDFDARATVTDSGDELDGLAAGIHMLAEEISAKFAENDRLVKTLEQTVKEMAQRHETIMALSTPSMMVWRGILVVPIIGMMDSARAQKFNLDLLNRISNGGAEVVIVDITGIAEMDLAMAKHLMQTFSAVSLLGSQCILTGLSAANARKVAALDVDLQSLTVRGNLHEGLALAFSLTGRRVIEQTTTERKRL